MLVPFPHNRACSALVKVTDHNLYFDGLNCCEIVRFTRGGSARSPKGFSSITFEQNNLETSNFA